ncbi:MAG: branched-chain amino acid ABC transporter permease [Betaproteobacteria bacterium]|jgi:branched-chain amino acid transport system permease protein|nr:MAG: branched-chain amino acid ABC transporter permease [Betaproteobacteria bacterium]
MTLTARGWRVIPILELTMLAALLVMPAGLDHFWVIFVTRVMILGMLALSFDLVWGHAGIMSFGQALFFGAAGYAVAIVARDLDLTSVFVVLPLAMFVGLILSFFVGWFLLMTRFPPTIIFLALGTLTASYVGQRLALSWYYLGGQNGIPSIPPLTIGDYALYEGTSFYYLVLGLLLIVYLGCRWLVRSQFGLVLAGIRQQETRLTFLGYRVQTYKTIVFTLAGTIAGLGGGLLAFHDGFIWPNAIGIILSTQAVIFVLFGGAGTLIGALIGVGAIEYAGFELADRYPDIWPIILGAILLIVVMFRPSGLIGLLVPERERFGSFGRPEKSREKT